MEKQRIYIAIDLKSFYASVECVERGLDPLTTNLVVADASHTEKTICLAVSPSLKSYGIGGRSRLFEVIQKVREVNYDRKRKAPSRTFTGKSFHDPDIKANPSLQLDYIVAPPQMAKYMQVSTKVNEVYRKYVSEEDIVVYSIDEVFMDVTDYLSTYKLTAQQLAMKIILDVLNTTGITATAGIGTNLFLAKVAMDITAKHIPPDENGVRIAELDEMSFRQKLWDHRPLTDFWRIGNGIANKLEAYGLYTLGDVCLCSEGKLGGSYNEDLLYKLFGINAELIIDHAWGWEPCGIPDIKSYVPSANSISSGQVLHCPYTAEKARLIVREMTDLLVLDLVDKKLVTNQVVLTIGYDVDNLKNEKIRRNYYGEVTIDRYGRETPKHAHGTENLKRPTSSTKQLMDAVVRLYDRIINKDLLVRRINITFTHIKKEDVAEEELRGGYEQLDLFTDYAAERAQREEEQAALAKERKRQETVIAIQKKYGKNSMLKGMNFEDGATTKERNHQIGGHKA